MRKFLLILLMLVVVGCSSESNVSEEKVVVTKEIKCNLDGTNFTLVLENGQIVKYIDEVDGDLGQETVDILNSEHLVGNSDNDKALIIMDSALKDLGGYCN